jgi:protein CpxP
MTKRILNRVLIAVLLISNLLLLGFIFFSKPPHPPRPKHIIVKKLSFDKGQIAKYESLIKTHQEGIMQLEAKMKASKTALYKSLLKNEDNPTNDSLFAELGNTQIEIEKLHYQHFREIKKICRTEQIPAFEALSGELVNLFNRGGMKKGKRK